MVAGCGTPIRWPWAGLEGVVTFFLKTEIVLRIFGKIRNIFGFSQNISDFSRMSFFCSEECVTDVLRARTCFPGGNMPFGRSLTLFIIVSAGAIPQ